MNHPGVWIMGDLADDDRNHGMGIVVEYADRTGKPQWLAPPDIQLELLAVRQDSTSAQAPTRLST